MVLKTLKSAMEKILSDDEIVSTKKNSIYVTDNELKTAYSLIKDTVGKDNLILIGGCAISKYITHKSADIDVAVRYSGNMHEFGVQLREKGFDEIQKVHHPSFGKDAIVYKTVYNSATGKKIPVDIYTRTIEGIDNLLERGKRIYIDDTEIKIADPYCLASAAYSSWKHRLFNGRGDKDYNYLTDLDESFGDDMDLSGYFNKIKQNRLSRLISVAGVYIAGMVRDAIRN